MIEAPTPACSDNQPSVGEYYKGYRGHGYHGKATVHIAGSSSRELTRTLQRRRKRRSAIEPKIGHLKSDHRMGRCFLRGLRGDAINAVLAATGSNLRKLMKRLFFVHELWLALVGLIRKNQAQTQKLTPAFA